MKVSAIISNFNGARFLPRLLDTLRGQIGVEVEVIVVDRESSDDSRSILAGRDRVKVLNEPPERGLVAGYDRGAREASSDLLFFCNEDMWFDSECLSRLAERIDLPNRIGAADPWQWSYDGRQWIHGITRFVACPWAINSPHPFRAAQFQRNGPEGSRVPFPSAGAFLIHRGVYEELGGWDTRFYLDHEDIDLFLRAWQRGWKCVSVPLAKVYHAVNASNDQVLKSMGQKVSRRRYISQRTNLALIALKYFSGPLLPLTALQIPVACLNNLLKGRFQMALWDLEIAREISRHFRSTWASRAANSPHNFYHPGERFFFEPEFSLDQSSISRE